jgi:peptide/nickel transport system permease protein
MDKTYLKAMTFRGLEYALTFFIIMVINFFLPRILPGGPLLSIIGTEGSDMPVIIDEATKQRLADYYHLNDPLHVQFINYLVDTAHLNFGYSIYYNVPVIDVLAGRLPWTLLLMGSALIVATLLGIFLGLESSWRHGKVLDKSLLVIIPVLKSIPVFFLGSLVIFIFGFKLGLFPISGAITPYADYANPLGMVYDVLSHLALPMTCLVIFEITGSYLLVRNVCVQQLERPYIVMAIARGLKDRNVKRHMLKNSLAPVINQVAAMLGFLVSGAIFIEMIFAYPGMGLLIYNSFIDRDYPVLQAAFIVMSVCVLGCNYAADLICGYIDGRARQG